MSLALNFWCAPYTLTAVGFAERPQCRGLSGTFRNLGLGTSQRPYQAAAQGEKLLSPASKLGNQQGSFSEHVSEHSHSTSVVWDGGVTARPNAPALGGCAATKAPPSHPPHLKRPANQTEGSALEVGLLLTTINEVSLSRIGHKKCHTIRKRNLIPCISGWKQIVNIELY